MTDKETMQMALDAIESGNTLKLTRAVVSLTQALARPERQPLTEEQTEVLDCLELDNVEYSSAFIDNDSVIKFVRAIEAAHGIKETE
jgi:hypothetical protein